MKSNYYYFIASLPHLSFAAPKPIFYDHFLSLCNSFLHEKDFKTIKSISFAGNDASHLHVIKSWMAWDGTLRRELASLRSAGLGRQSIIYGRPDQAGQSDSADQADMTHTVKVAKEAFAISMPLDADEFIEKARWEYIESLEFGRYFDVEWLALYSLKLQILERREKFDKKAGLLRLHELMDRAREDYELTEAVKEAALG